MGSWLARRRLTRVGSRLKSLRAELAELDEQVAVFADAAEDEEIRALVSETPGAAHDASETRKHADAIRRHRRHVADRIAELERRQDELLDELTVDR